MVIPKEFDGKSPSLQPEVNAVESRGISTTAVIASWPVAKAEGGGKRPRLQPGVNAALKMGPSGPEPSAERKPRSPPKRKKA
jgi:hypothetical protein